MKSTFSILTLMAAAVAMAAPAPDALAEANPHPDAQPGIYDPSFYNNNNGWIPGFPGFKVGCDPCWGSCPIVWAQTPIDWRCRQDCNYYLGNECYPCYDENWLAQVLQNCPAPSYGYYRYGGGSNRPRYGPNLYGGPLYGGPQYGPRYPPAQH